MLSLMGALLTDCTRQQDNDADLRSRIVGTWTTANVNLPDKAEVSAIEATYRTDGSWASRYTITRGTDSRKQTTSGKWQIEDGSMFEEQTNVDGASVDTREQRAGSKILKLNSHEMVLSNWYAPRRVFLRKD
jgi:hypothetical protein